MFLSLMQAWIEILSFGFSINVKLSCELSCIPKFFFITGFLITNFLFKVFCRLADSLWREGDIFSEGADAE
jgi:hypothetical protein